MSASRMIRIGIGVLGVLIGVSLLIGAAVVLWAQVSLRDADGFYSSPQYRLNAAGHAITLDNGDLGAGPPLIGETRAVPATLRLRVAERGSGPVFVGIARQDEVDAYLRGVSRAEVSDLDERASVVSTRVLDGAATPAPPGEQTFWAASVTGSETQTLTWPVQGGRWTVVVMNASGAGDVDVTASAGARVAYLTEIGLVVLVLAALVLLASALALFPSRRGPTSRAEGAAREPDAPADRLERTVDLGAEVPAVHPAVERRGPQA